MKDAVIHFKSNASAQDQRIFDYMNERSCIQNGVFRPDKFPKTDDGSESFINPLDSLDGVLKKGLHDGRNVDYGDVVK